MDNGEHLGHDGKTYRTLQARNPADKVFDQINAGRRGKGIAFDSSLTVPGSSFTSGPFALLRAAVCSVGLRRSRAACISR